MNKWDFSKPRYYKITKKYLLKIYTKQQIVDAKYLKRPFIGFEGCDIMISIPERTIHKPHKFKYPYNFYFSDNIHYLDIASFIYVPINERIPFITNSEDFSLKLSEISRNQKIIELKLKEIIDRIKRDNKFNMEHKHISISHKLCFNSNNNK